MYSDFLYRPPPPSYQASMQEYRLRLLLLDNRHGQQQPTAATANNATAAQATAAAAAAAASPSDGISPPPLYRAQLRYVLHHIYFLFRYQCGKPHLFPGPPWPTPSSTAAPRAITPRPQSTRSSTLRLRLRQLNRRRLRPITKTATPLAPTTGRSPTTSCTPGTQQGRRGLPPYPQGTYISHIIKHSI